mgnify:FL=1
MSLVSIILPYYKKINYIANTLNSILNQTYQNFEIILVYDDTKLDDLLLIEHDFKNNPKIKVIKNARNLGAGISRNIGIKHSKGEIIAFIDADDLWLPNKLEKQTNFMKENNFQFTFCDYEKRISNNKVIKVISPKKFLDYNDLIKSNDIGLSTVQINKNIIPDDLFPSLKTKEDFVAWLKITKKKINAYNFSENLVIWNKVHNSLSSNFFQKISDGFKVYRDYEKFSLLKSLYFILILSKNSVKRKF